MAKDGKIYLKVILFFCLVLGLAGGLLFNEIAGMVHTWLVSILPNLRPDIASAIASLEPALSHVLVGFFVFGISSYLLCRSAVSLFARSLLGSLVRLMRARNLLPYTFKLAKKEKLRYVHENLISIFDVYVQKLQEADNEKTRFQEALGKYADPTVAGVLKYNKIDTKIPSSRKKVAVLFADIRGFTPMTESLMPEEVVMILNEHFAACTAAINRNQGKVNKFIGDAVMAIFEEPPAYKQDESAARSAINAGLELAERFEQNARSWVTRITKPVSFGIGVGIHSGMVILGNIGSSERMEYTAIGDTVNLSSRLCSLAKPGQVIVSEECFQEAQLYFKGEAQEPQKIKGKTGLYTTYAVRRMLQT